MGYKIRAAQNNSISYVPENVRPEPANGLIHQTVSARFGNSRGRSCYLARFCLDSGKSGRDVIPQFHLYTIVSGEMCSFLGILDEAHLDGYAAAGSLLFLARIITVVALCSGSAPLAITLLPSEVLELFVRGLGAGESQAFSNAPRRNGISAGPRFNMIVSRDGRLFFYFFVQLGSLYSLRTLFMEIRHSENGVNV